MLSVPEFSPLIWLRSVADTFTTAASFVVFAFLDLLDVILCLFYSFLDGIVEESPIPCYCYVKNGEKNEGEEEAEEREEVSETLHGRKNLFRGMGILSLRRRSRGGGKERGVSRRQRWSDCGCDTCGRGSGTFWDIGGEDRLHLVLKEPSLAESRNEIDSSENVLFVHGFLSSSSFWLETIFPEAAAAQSNFRMFAVDLLGFGRSPKPANCLYRVKDHIEMIERSVVEPFRLHSFHLVAHSMGCIIALALAAKYPTCVESITLVAPPYFPSDYAKASYNTLNKLAERKIWPPLLFGSSVMSWYEHVGRTVCFVYCRNHLIWEWILKTIMRKRDLNFAIRDIPKHTHHSAWHTMHNVICGGAKLQDKHLEVVKKAGIPVKVIHGDKDQVVPIECSYNMKSKFPLADLIIIKDANHNTVIIGKENDFTKELVDFWLSSRKQKLCEDEKLIE